jgi:hypothetical protein
MICWLMGWQKAKATELPLWKPVVYGQLPDLLPGEPCKPTLVAPLKENVTCTRCREAYAKRNETLIDAYLKGHGR